MWTDGQISFPTRGAAGPHFPEQTWGPPSAVQSLLNRQAVEVLVPFLLYS